MADLQQRLRNLLFIVPYVVRHRGVPVEELAERLGISRTDLLKELDFLLMVGRPPFFPDDMVDIYHEGGRVFVNLHQSLENPPGLTAFEVVALATAAKLLLEDEGLGEAANPLEVAVSKIVDSLPAEARKLFDELSPRYVMLAGESGMAPQLEILRKAIDERREIELEYFAASRMETSSRTVRPYGLHLHRGFWYLAAHCLERESKRVFRLSRIRKISLSRRIFDPPEEGFNTADFVENSLTVPATGKKKVSIRFSAKMARWIQERWGPEYIKEELDGSIIAILHDVSDEFVLSYVASFGGDACIEEPPELALELKRQAVAALARYQ